MAHSADLVWGAVFAIVGTTLAFNFGNAADRVAAISKFSVWLAASKSRLPAFIRGIGIVWAVVGVLLVAVGLRQ